MLHPNKSSLAIFKSVMDNTNTSVPQDTGQEVDETVSQGEEIESMPNSEETSEPAEASDELSDVSERTRKEFEKLKQRNAELAKKLTTYERKERFGDSVYDRGVAPQVNTQNLTNAQVDDIVDSFVDANGYVDTDKLNRALQIANQRAKRAEQATLDLQESIRQREEAKQLREAYKVAPWIDPNSDTFDQKKYNLVKDRLIRHQVEKGYMPDLVDVVSELEGELADFVSPTQKTQAEKKAVEQYKDTLTKKTVAGSVASGRGNPRTEPEENLTWQERLKKIV